MAKSAEGRTENFPGSAAGQSYSELGGKQSQVENVTYFSLQWLERSKNSNLGFSAAHYETKKKTGKGGQNPKSTKTKKTPRSTKVHLQS